MFLIFTCFFLYCMGSLFFQEEQGGLFLTFFSMRKYRMDLPYWKHRSVRIEFSIRRKRIVKPPRQTDKEKSPFTVGIFQRRFILLPHGSYLQYSRKIEKSKVFLFFALVFSCFSSFFWCLIDDSDIDTKLCSKQHYDSTQ